MKITLDKSKLKDKKIFVATPMYGGMCTGSYCNAAINLAIAAKHFEVELKYFFIFNESLIQRARNYCADEFLRSGYTHLMFIDADINFNPVDVLYLSTMGKDIVGGPYPKKNISWGQVMTAARSKQLQNELDENPKQLSQYAGDLVFNLIENKKTIINVNEPMEVAELGTGFMMISREVLEKYKDSYPELEYKPDHLNSKNFSGDRNIHAFFDSVIDPESKRYLSEDYMFVKYARKIGFRAWVCPWMKLTHTGTYIFEGDITKIASLGSMTPIDNKFGSLTKLGVDN